MLTEELTVFTDSDWAGCKETRKSSSAGVLMLGRHTLKAYTRKQKVIAKSSAEAELGIFEVKATPQVTRNWEARTSTSGLWISACRSLSARTKERN